MGIIARLITPFFLFCGFFLLFIVSLSLPIINTVFLFEVADNRHYKPVVTSIGTSIRFGIWGVCVGAYNFEVSPPRYDHASQCTGPNLGYDIDPSLLNIIGNAGLIEALLKGVIAILVIHPIAAGITFLAFLFSLLYAIKPRIPHVIPICTLLLSIPPAVLSSIVFVLDIVVVIFARAKVEDATDGGLTVRWGNAVWMTAAACACLWIGLIGLSTVACGCWSLGRAHPRSYEEYRDLFEAQFKEKPRRDSTYGRPTYPSEVAAEGYSPEFSPPMTRHSRESEAMLRA